MTESVDEYLDDVETAALSWDLMLTPGIIEPTNKSKIRFFRQNLEKDGDAWHWWYFVLPEADKKDYGKSVAEFRERYGVKVSQASSLLAVQNEMLSLTQGELEHIRDYVYQVEKLSRKIPREMDSLFAIAFIKARGVRDQERRQRVTFDLKDTANFSFLKALAVVKLSSQEIGEPDPFRPLPKFREVEPIANALYTTPPVPQVNAIGRADLPASFSANQAPSVPLTQEQFNAFMTAYETSIGRFNRSSSASSALQVNRRNNPRVTCLNCGVRRHYSEGCTHTPATGYEQQQIRDQVRRGREQVEYDNQVSERRTIKRPLSGANTIEITPRAMLPRPSAEEDLISAAPSSTTQVSCVRSFTVSRQDLGNACVVFVTGPSGPRTRRAPASIPRPAPVNALGRGFFFFNPCPCPCPGLRPVQCPAQPAVNEFSPHRAPLFHIFPSRTLLF